MNRKLPRASALLAAEMIGGTSIVGVAQSAVEHGMWAALFNVGLALSLLCGVLAYALIYRSLDTFSVPAAAAELVGRGFRKPVVALLCLTYLGILSVEIAAASAVVSKVLGVSLLAGRILVLLLMVLPALGGLRLTSAWNMVFGAVLLALLGITALNAPLARISFFGEVPSTRDAVMWLVFTPLSFVASQPLAQSAAWCDHEGVSPVKAALMAFPLVVLVGLLSAAITLATGARAGRATIFVAAYRISPLCGILVSLAVVAAIVTTAPTILVALSTLTEELLGKLPTVSGETSVRRLGIPLMLLALLLSLQVKSIVSGLSYSFAPRAILGMMLLVVGVREVTRRKEA